MLQRIQSIWLLIAAVLIFLTLKLSFYSGTFILDNQYHQLKGTDNVLVMIVTILLGILTTVTIFLFKNRKLQLRLSVLAIILELLLVYLYYRETLNYSQGVYAITAAFHVVILIALFLAIRGIRSDEKLIRDSDRLR